MDKKLSNEVLNRLCESGQAGWAGMPSGELVRLLAEEVREWRTAHDSAEHIRKRYQPDK